MSILDVKMLPNDADAETVRDYLVTLLRTLWEEDEGFSGKRPFGNSGWKYEVYRSLAAAGVIKAELEYRGDPDDPYDLDEWDYGTNEADLLVLDAIKEIGASA
jgi:hypothetical protein